MKWQSIQGPLASSFEKSAYHFVKKKEKLSFFAFLHAKHAHIVTDTFKSALW